MRRKPHRTVIVFSDVALLALTTALPRHAQAQEEMDCLKFDIDVGASRPMKPTPVDAPTSCTPRLKQGLPLPDPNCTPGAVNPTLTQRVLRDPAFRTACVRDNATTATEKRGTYALYDIKKPADNKGVKQICELDQLVPLVLGGADTLDNIWPKCGPSRVILRNRFFKKKDRVEMYLARRVQDGSMKFKDAQLGIATDWTQYIEQASKRCRKLDCDD